MLLLLSPAKALDYETPLPPELTHTLPAFIKDSARLIEALRQYSPQQLARLMSLSDPLAALNAARYAAWSPHATEGNARQAIMAFNGDVYEGLQARTLSAANLAWAQQHVAILSGLYGVLRPLDWMQPYRLEMGTRLVVGDAANLYQFWGPRIAQHLNLSLAGDPQPTVLNLASQEYFKSVDCKTLQARVVECVFQDWNHGQYKIVSFYAKRARGLMARWAIEQRATSPEQLTEFHSQGYTFSPEASTSDRLVFRRMPLGNAE